MPCEQQVSAVNGARKWVLRFAIATANINAKGVMKKVSILVSGVILSIAAQPMLAQRGGDRWRDTGFVRDFRETAVVQASEAQSAQLHSWAQRAALLNRQLEDIRNASKRRKVDDLSDELDAFKAALVADNMDRQEFLASLSEVQRAELQKPVRQLDGATNAMAKALSEISEGFGQADNSKLLRKGLERVKKAIANERDEQRRLARAMGTMT